MTLKTAFKGTLTGNIIEHVQEEFANNSIVL